ncbi:uncharacterized protein [Physcomitrium patens]|uniref:Uncharacterized protein n=1 Tax=Physcomitrium patens TaxID=3218 RepID=A0A2K1L393_PHYPA|nr:uncharacterized protein LOC112295264 [Physcomitrium patens]PNR60500.1 hypothetical protein PHYPA_003293 [Physcomitrium patens]|eukprot:XP_024402350.1 uncharacterized protein LOC112295264 [Physcomitrella patens]
MAMATLAILSTSSPCFILQQKSVASRTCDFVASSPFFSRSARSRSFTAPSALNRAVGTDDREAPAAQFSRRDALAFLAGVSGDIGFSRAWNQNHYANAFTEGKQTNLSVEQVKEIIENDIRKGQYYVTGNLTPSIYRDNCKFTDPTTVVTGVNKYVAAVRLLFDPDLSQQELLSIDVTGPRTIEVNWRLGGYLKLPWKPHITPYEGSTRYTLGDDGLIESHDETWNISLLTALLELFTSTWGPH